MFDWERMAHSPATPSRDDVTAEWVQRELVHILGKWTAKQFILIDEYYSVKEVYGIWDFGNTFHVLCIVCY